MDEGSTIVLFLSGLDLMRFGCKIVLRSSGPKFVHVQFQVASPSILDSS